MVGGSDLADRKKLTPDDVYWGSLLGIAEMIRAGTTSFADMYFHMDSVARAVEESGMRALLAYGTIAPQPDSRVASELQVAESLIDGFPQTADGRIRVAVSPHAPYTCAPAVWEGALAERYGTLIHAHIAETRREVEEARARSRRGESLTLLQRLGDKQSIASSLSGLGSVALCQGDYERAAALFGLGNVARCQGDIKGLRDATKRA